MSEQCAPNEVCIWREQRGSRQRMILRSIKRMRRLMEGYITGVGHLPLHPFRQSIVFGLFNAWFSILLWRPKNMNIVGLGIQRGKIKEREEMRHQIFEQSGSGILGYYIHTPFWHELYLGGIGRGNWYARDKRRHPRHCDLTWILTEWKISIQPTYFMYL